MPLSDLAQKLRATMPDESPIDLDDHAERIAEEVQRVQRGGVFCRRCEYDVTAWPTANVCPNCGACPLGVVRR